MNFSGHLWRRLVPAFCVLIFAAFSAAETGYSAEEHDVAAALTIRIAKFVGWPERAVIDAGQSFFLIGVIGGNEVQAAFDQFAGRVVHGRLVKVVEITPATVRDELKRCHIVYAERADDVRLIKGGAVRSKGVLTVAGPGSRASGVTCLEIVRDGGKLSFDINLKHTRRASLGVDAGVIRLAHNVTR